MENVDGILRCVLCGRNAKYKVKNRIGEEELLCPRCAIDNEMIERDKRK